MGLTSAMYTGLSGLNVNQTRVETIGHNISNVNTTAFKGSRTLFQTQFSETLSRGTPPSDTSGGTNPSQIGHGALVGTTQRLTTGGAVETTGVPSDMAIEGAGYFVVHDPNGRVFYTRDGSFVLNAANQLVTMDGYRVQGFGVDDNFTIIPGTLRPLDIPLGRLNVARATQNVALDGDLSAAEAIATQGAAFASQAFVNGGGAAATAATALSDLRSAAQPGMTLFATADVITVSGATRGERVLPARQFTVGTTGSTLGDFAAWLQESLGIQVDPALPGNPGVTVENGALVIRSNAGVPNALRVRSTDLVSTNAGQSLPFQMTQTAAASGGGVFTSFTVYDSLGNAIPVNAAFTLESTPNTGPVWRYYLESAAPGQEPQMLGTGTVTFNTEGRFVSASGNTFSLNRTNTGAASPVQFTLNLEELNGLSTETSNVILAEQDGYPPGSLISFAVGNDGTVTGVFTNGLTRPIGQVALATFSNEAGLVAETDNLFSIAPNSGPPAVSIPGTLGAGLIHGGALEMSNVDLAREFIGLITSSAGFQANSRVISVANEMMDQLLMTLR